MKILITMAALAGLAVPGLALAQGAAPATATALGEGHARSAMTTYGCANISGLSAGPSGSWHGQCYKGGSPVSVMMDSEGKVVSGTAPTHITEGHARSALTQFGCANISGLYSAPDGAWAGQCYKGGQPVNVMVDNTGKALPR